LVWDNAERAANGCDVFLVAGTSAQVYPAAGLIDLATRAGARTIEVNLDETAYSSRVTFSLRGRCGEILPAILAK
jgi:NAD-dependent deacetylase